MPKQSNERRRSGRPNNGDTQRCPVCAGGQLEFSERSRIQRRTGKVTMLPAWVCDACPHWRPVRQADQPASTPRLKSVTRRKAR